jgi:hypothetical protein
MSALEALAPGQSHLQLSAEAPGSPPSAAAAAAAAAVATALAGSVGVGAAAAGGGSVADAFGARVRAILLERLGRAEAAQVRASTGAGGSVEVLAGHMRLTCEPPSLHVRLPHTRDAPCLPALPTGLGGSGPGAARRPVYGAAAARGGAGRGMGGALRRPGRRCARAGNLAAALHTCFGLHRLTFWHACC